MEQIGGFPFCLYPSGSTEETKVSPTAARPQELLDPDKMPGPCCKTQNI